MIAKSLKLAVQGTYSGVNHRVNRQLNRNQLPTFLVFQLTNQCNSRCAMCNIWKKDSSGELTTDNIAQVFFTTLLAMGVFLLFGYGLFKLYKKNN